MSLHPDTLYWLRANESLLLLKAQNNSTNSLHIVLYIHIIIDSFFGTPYMQIHAYVSLQWFDFFSFKIYDRVEIVQYVNGQPILQNIWMGMFYIPVLWIYIWICKGFHTEVIYEWGRFSTHSWTSAPKFTKKWIKKNNQAPFRLILIVMVGGILALKR
jgi:hypothetical protein